ncbi:MAG: serine/threonine-protein kinase [Planctomycetota bacterium]
MTSPSLNEEQIFKIAREIAAPDARIAYLQQACGDDEALRQRVVALLHVAEEDPSFLEKPPAGCAATSGEQILERPGTQIGPYKLIEQIGEGGFGVVFVAEQKELVRRTVALKVLKPGMDTRQVIARFEAERQALAMMDHPHIAKVLDAGATESGRPFFVMELVRGVPITQFCDQRKLTPRQRLELFVPVCQAIQHAHQKGVIHRDIKPSNVLVALYDERAVPKVIDFGVAKAAGQPLTDKTLITNFGALVGTVEYMSPEQASLNNLDIDTRSDVYSLGVLLYELLTGVTPVDRGHLQQGALLEMLRIVREVETPRPSTKLSTSDALPSIAANRSMEPAKLSECMKGELDWVLLKALEKDRTRRYETANALARDIERYLADELIEARPPSTGYRLRKLASKHRTALSTVAAIVLCLIVGASVSIWQAIRASRAEHLAIESADVARQAQAQALDNESEAQQQRHEAERQHLFAESQRDEAERQRTTAQAEKSAAQQNLVTSQFLLGKIANTNGDTAGALTWYLQAYHDAPPDDPRRVSARNLIGAWGGSLKQTLVHDAGVHTVAVSADGRKLIAGVYNKHAQIWDIATGMPQGKPLEKGGDIVSAQLSADGSFALIGDWGGATVWDVATGQPRYPSLEHFVREDTVVGPVLSPDDRSIVTRNCGTGICLWDAETGNPRGECLPLGKLVRRMFFAPDSKRVAALGGGVARVWDVEKAQPVGEEYVDITDLAFHPDGRHVAVSRKDGKILLHDLDSGQQVAELTHDKPLNSVDFDKEGKNLVTQDGENAYLWLNVLNDERTRRVLPHGRQLFAAAFSAAEGWVLTTSPMLLRVWKVGADAPKWERSVPQINSRWQSDDMRSAVFSPDGRTLLVRTGNNSVEVLSAWSGEMLAREANVLKPIFAADGKSLIAGSRDGWVRVRSVSTSRRLPKRLSPEACSGSEMALSPDGTLVFVVGGKSSQIFRTDTWEPVGKPMDGLFHDYKDVVTGAAFSPDNRVLVTSMHLRGSGPSPHFSPSTHVTFWDVATTNPIGKPISTGDALSGLAFDPTGRNLRFDGSVVDVRTRSMRTFKWDGLPKGHRAVAQLLGSNDSSVPLLWDEDRGGPTTVAVPSENVKQALLSPDGRSLLIVDQDGNARLQDAASETPRGPAFHPEGSPSERSRDGRYTLFGTLTTLRLWDTWLGRPCGEPLQNEMAQATASFSPCGTILATHWHFTAQLWDCATGLALGPPMDLSSNQISQPIFTADGRRLYIASNGLEVWRVPPPAADDPERLRLSIEVRTGLEVNENATIQKLSHAGWLERKRRLEQLGGPCDVVE